MHRLTLTEISSFFFLLFYFFIVVVHLSILPAQTKPFQFRCAMRIKFIILVMGRQCNSILSVVSSQCRDAPFLPTLGSISLSVSVCLFRSITAIQPKKLNQTDSFDPVQTKERKPTRLSVAMRLRLKSFIATAHTHTNIHSELWAAWLCSRFNVCHHRRRS